MRDWLRAAARWSVRSYLVFVLLGLLLGALLTPLVAGPDRGDGTIAVVAVDGSIDGTQLERYQRAMERARAEADAVVLVANSGGGSASASEAMYLQTRRTAEAMPVVTVVGAAAASGAYYTIVPADRIYVKPASIVGSVGVVAQVPPGLEPNDVVGTTGPDKLTGGAGRAFYYKLDTLQAAFLNAVYATRGDRLAVERAELARATTFTGARAVQLGLADGIGDRQRAIRTAAELAGLEDPRVVVYGDGDERTFLLRSTYLASSAPEKRLISSGPFFTRSDGLPTYLMVPPAVAARGVGDAEASTGDRQAVATASADTTQPTNGSVSPRLAAPTGGVADA